VPAAIFSEALVDAISQPEQGELAQRREVTGPEVVRERGVDPLGRVDIAAGEPVPQGERREVDQLQLVSAADDLVGDRLALVDGRDLLDDVLQRLQMLDIQRRDHVDASRQELLHVLPAPLVAPAGHVRVGELVDERHLRPPGEHGVDVHLLEDAVAVADLLLWDDLEVGDLRRRLGTSVRLDEAYDDVLAVVAAAPTLV
jgi:hypothetical protein